MISNKKVKDVNQTDFSIETIYQNDFTNHFEKKTFYLIFLVGLIILHTVKEANLLIIQFKNFIRYLKTSNIKKRLHKDACQSGIFMFLINI